MAPLSFVQIYPWWGEARHGEAPLDTSTLPKHHQCPKSLPSPNPGLPGTPSLQGAPCMVTLWQGQEETKAQALPQIWHPQPAQCMYQEGRRKAALYLAKRQIGSLKKSSLLWKAKTKQNPHPVPLGRLLAVPAYRHCHHLLCSVACPGQVLGGAIARPPGAGPPMPSVSMDLEGSLMVWWF